MEISSFYQIASVENSTFSGGHTTKYREHIIRRLHESIAHRDYQKMVHHQTSLEMVVVCD